MANQYTKAREKQRKEIFWNVVNSGLAGLLVFLGGVANGGLTWKGAGAAVVAALIVAVTKFKDFWSAKKKEYSNVLFSFVG